MALKSKYCDDLYLDGNLLPTKSYIDDIPYDPEARIDTVYCGSRLRLIKSSFSHKKLYNIIVKLCKRIKKLQEEFATFEFKNGVCADKYMVYGRITSSSGTRFFMVKTDSLLYNGYWPCYEYELTTDLRRSLNDEKEKYKAFLQKVGDCTKGDAEDAAWKYVENKILKVINKIIAIKNPSLKRAFVVYRNILAYRRFLNDFVQVYSYLLNKEIIKNDKNAKWKKQEAVVDFKEVGKVLILDRANPRLIDYYTPDEQ